MPGTLLILDMLLILWAYMEGERDNGGRTASDRHVISVFIGVI